MNSFPILLILAGGVLTAVLVYCLITFVNWRENRKLGKRREDWSLFPLVFLALFLAGCVNTTDPATGKTVRTLSPAARAALNEAFDLGVKVARAKLDEATGPKVVHQK